MSRLAKKPINIPEKTTVVVSGLNVSVKGPSGEIGRTFHKNIKVVVEGNGVVITPAIMDKETAALWGTTASHIKNMIMGVGKPFQKKLIVEGIGFKSEVKGTDLVLALGFSHPVKVAIPSGLKVSAEKNVISISGVNKESVGQFAALVRALKKPEPYKGKGIHYENEVVRRKEGKKTV